MTIKEKPLINAVDSLGPLPFVRNPVFTGVFTTFMCIIIIATIVFFQVFGRGFTEAAEIYQEIRISVYFSFFFLAAVFIFMALRAIGKKDQVLFRLLFVVGGILGMLFYTAIDFVAADLILGWLTEFGPLVH